MGVGGLFLILCVGIPALVGTYVCFAKPIEFAGWINNASAGVHHHYQAVSSKDSIFANIWAAVIWAPHKIHGWTDSIEDEATRAGVRFGSFFFAVGMSLIVIASLLYVALVIAVLIVGIWFLSRFFADGTRPERYDDEPPMPASARRGRSRERTDWLGNPYTEHLDEDGSRRGKSVVKKDWLGNSYVETTNVDGETVETSRARKDWLGNDYVEHRNSSDEIVGESREREDWLGNPYTEHRDSQREERGRSRSRTDWLGKDYTEHEPKD